MKFELPLFPLNTVLFPGMPLSLHIFEDRYKKMIQSCLDDKKLFGVVLIRKGQEALGPLAEPYSVGCTARIFKVQTLSEGHMQITTIGEKRFRIQSLSHQQVYLVGEVEHYPLEIEISEQVYRAAGSLRPKIRQYIHLLNQVDDVEIDPEILPEEPQVLAFLAAGLLQMPADKKQELLDSGSLIELLNLTNLVYQREIAFLRAIISQDVAETEKRFSQN
jgi:Lon protease-like protein